MTSPDENVAQALNLATTSTDDSQEWTKRIELPEGVTIRLATLDDLPRLVELEAFWHNDGLTSDEATLRRRLENHPAGQLVAVGPDGQLLGVMYSQRVATYASLLSTTRATELELHTPNGPVIQLLAVLQRPGAKRVGDIIRRTMLHYGRMDPTVERACGITRCRNFDPTGDDTSLTAYRAHVDAGNDPGLLFHSLAGAFVCDLVPGYRPGDAQNLAYGVIISYEFRDAGLHQAKEKAAMLSSRVPTLPHGARIGSVAPRSIDECERIVIEMIGPLTTKTRNVIQWDAATKRMGFMDLGIDSLDAQKLALNLNARLGLSLNDTVIFEQSNVSELGEFVHMQLGGKSLGIAPALQQRMQMGQDQFQGVAAARACWPGSTGTAFALQPAGGDSVGQIPSQRWTALMSPVPAGRFGAFLPHAERFSGAFFGISPAEVSSTDPQQRLLLEYTYQATHTAGQRREALRGDDVGVFLGIMNADFGTGCVESGSVYAATGGTISIAAGRISFVLGTQGPCTSYDTACSSGLVASHAAASAMRLGECASGLVLAVSLMLSPQVS
jgi:hypothetical protein